LALQTANTAQKGYKPVAEVTLTAAREALLAIETALNTIPLDADPRVVALITARDAAVLTLSALRDGADLLDIGGLIRGEIQVTVGINGLGGASVGELCHSDGSNCTTLSGGRVSFFPTAELCMELFGAPEQCLAI
jgi:hypothetical protein